jgi:hypothetical protein
MGKSTPMDREAADRISEAAWRDPCSDTAQSGFDVRAQEAADRNEQDDSSPGRLRVAAELLDDERAATRSP